MKMNLVFNLESVDELKRLAAALEEVATLQAKINLEGQIRTLNAQKELLNKEISDLRKIRDELSPDKKDNLTAMKEKEEMEDEAIEERQALSSDSASITRRIVETEENERATTPEDSPS